LLLAGFFAQMATTEASAQGNLSGDFMMNYNFFMRDTSIRAGNNPLYDNYLSGGEGWLNLRYAYKGFTGIVRFDGFHNSNLQNPTSALTAQGIGQLTLQQQVKDLTITAGHVYDQIGSGILFRAYEDRGLLIDNALFGFHLKYRLAENLTVKAFTGQMKKIAQPITFNAYSPIIKGLNIEGDVQVGEKLHLTPGAGVLNRTLDQNSMGQVVNSINALDTGMRFTPKYNMYAATVYNTLSYGPITWYVEGALKSQEAILKPDDKTGNQELQNLSGNVIYSTLGFGVNKFAVNASFKRTENFAMRTSPNETLLNGVINWQPIIARMRPQRLISRYSPASQDLSELAYSVDAFYNPSANYSFNAAYTDIKRLDNLQLYREVYGEAEIRSIEKMILTLSVQYLEYNQEVYQLKPGVPMIKAFTPMMELVYKINKKNSLRGEFQYMDTKQDYGSWMFALLEYNISPNWSFAVSDMYNVKPHEGVSPSGRHYPQVFTAFTKGANRFSLAYVKQVDGINCTGGVCRYEPAFSGVKMMITSSF
jgi:hypothetical protein